MSGSSVSFLYVSSVYLSLGCFPFISPYPSPDTLQASPSHGLRPAGNERPGDGAGLYFAMVDADALQVPFIEAAYPLVNPHLVVPPETVEPAHVCQLPQGPVRLAAVPPELAPVARL